MGTPHDIPEHLAARFGGKEHESLPDDDVMDGDRTRSQADMALAEALAGLRTVP
ncbi:hypothetical protein [Amycolatopsis orientalis]|uniref:hypothetical protein n=1 Tax=Amycolatopsis orientalis TaxID=31958 RepID=UPI000A78A099|nr:hypothetical protein [Amycolatopsis orientalis]